MFYKELKSSKGFTLMELVVVIVILGVLSAFVLPRFIDLTEDAKKAVTASTMGSFNSAVNQFHSKWMTSGKPANLTVDGLVTQINTLGYPTPSPAGSGGCITLWNSIMTASASLIAYPGNVAVSDWSALGIGTICIYINHGGDVFSGAQTPFFAYFATTGVVLGFNLN